uniref:UDP-glucuronosyltransferase n=1 Tax=Cacopsylla melanoneura TaxID=428564 RepID=A0A8D8WM44_9HEMI
MLDLTWTVLLTLLVISTAESANILAIFPTASYSHQMPLLAIARALAERGHNLTVITPNPLTEPKANYTEIDVSFSYEYWKPKSNKEQLIKLQKKMNHWEIIPIFQGFSKMIEIQLNSTPIQNFIKYIDREKVKFDLVLYEDLMHTAYLGILPKIGSPPLITLLTLNLPCSLDDCFGSVCNPSYVPDLMTGFTNKMSFLERFENYMFSLYMYIFINPKMFRIQDDLALKYFGLTSHSTIQLVQNKSLILSTTSWLYQYPRPVYPYTINVGPTHIGTTKPLPQDLESWIAGAEKGVIYFSLGSNMRSSSLEESKRNAILSVFGRFPQHRIIWKWEEEALPGLPKNVICRKWLPQHDLLAHPNIKLFITQGGLQSLQEAVYFEVPMIGIPFFGDQVYNVKIVKRLGIGNYIDFDDILENPEDLYVLMNEILTNNSYMETVKRVSAMSKTQMMSPRDTAVWWVEYVLKTGGNTRHLRPDNWDMSWIQYLGLDVLFILLSPVFLVLYGIYKLISLVRGNTRRKGSKKLKAS